MYIPTRPCSDLDAAHKDNLPPQANRSIVFQALSLYKDPLMHSLDEEIGREPGGVREKDVQSTWGIVQGQ